MTAQPYRGKLTRAKLRVLLALARRQPIQPRPQTVRALRRFGLVEPERLALTLIGAVAAARYIPRRRAA